MIYKYLSTFKKVSAGILVCAFCIALTSCNTVEGAGEDIEAAGNSIEEAAE